MASALTRVELRPLSLEPFAGVLPAAAWKEFQAVRARIADQLRGHVVWNVNSTAAGGGVAEILTSLIAYADDGGVDARWLVMHGAPPFFVLTKRIHNNLHGSPGDGGELGPAEHELYRQGTAPAAAELADLVRPGDVVILHDPQSAGMAGALAQRGVRVVWRCHIGIDLPHPLARRAWDFLMPFLEPVDTVIMSRREFAWQSWDPARLRIVPPSIDAFSVKNVDISDAAVQSILGAAAVMDVPGAPRTYQHEIEPGRSVQVRHPADVIEEQPLRPDDDLVLQVSRWDRLKDPLGVIQGFVEHGAAGNHAHLMLTGPQAVVDDPESAVVFAEAVALWRTLSPQMRRRIHLCALSMEDVEENALVVNAQQRHASVVVQKSLAEGFGLTVSEAMWKSRPVVASRVGGIQDQIEDGRSGVLVDDPLDLREFGQHVAALLADPRRRRDMGQAARDRVVSQFLATRHLEQWAAVVGGVF
jgi:trehalose synthase